MSHQQTEHKQTTCSDDEEKQILRECREAMQHSYCPYSNFPVGAALLTEQGVMFKGCNVENVAQTSSVCAERTAIVKAVSEGYTKFKAIAISSRLGDQFIFPCGVCRQVIAEFNIDMTVYATKANGDFMKFTARDLLPSAFTPSHLLSK